MTDYLLDLLPRYSPIQIRDAIFFIEMDRLHKSKFEALKNTIQKLSDRIPKYEPSQTNEMLEHAMREIGKVCQTAESFALPDKNESLRKVYDDLDGESVALPSPFRELNRLLGGGFYPGDVAIIAGRPGDGKTSFMLTVAASLSHKYHVGFISAEMSRYQLIQRLYSMLGRVDLRKIREKTLDASERSRIVGVMGTLDASDMNLIIDDRSSPTVRQIRAFLDAYPCDLLCIDYLQILRGPGRSLYEKVTNLSGEIKAIAKDYNLPLVCGCQVNRQVEARENKVPRLSELRESGAIEQDADVVLGLFHPEDKTKHSEVHVLKQRNGPSGVCTKINFAKCFTLFEDL